MQVRALVVVAAVGVALLAPAAGATGSVRDVVLPGTGQGEPSIAVAGPRVYVVAPAGVGLLWTSANGGRSFQARPGWDPGPAPSSGDTDVAVDPGDGTVYAVNLTHFRNDVRVSHDHGQTWGAAVLAGADADRPWLTAAAPHELYLTYHDVGGASIVVLRSTDGGASFHPTVPPLPADPGAQTDAAADSTLVARPVVPAGGGLVVPFVTNGHVRYALTTDGGATWTNRSIAATMGTAYGFPAAVMSGNRLVVVWAEQSGSATHVWSVTTDPRTGATSAPVEVDAGLRRDGNLLPAVTASGRTVVVAWYSSSAGPDSPAGSWRVTRAVSGDGGRTFGRPATLSAVVRRGALCAGLDCAGGSRDLLDFLSAVLTSHGEVYYAYASDVTGVRTHVAVETLPR